MGTPMANLMKQKTRFVIARSPHQAISIVNKVRDGLIKPKKVLHLTRDAALLTRNNMRMKYRVGYNVYEVPYSTLWKDK